MPGPFKAAVAALIVLASVTAPSAAPVQLQDQSGAPRQFDDTPGRTVLPYTLEEHRAVERAKTDVW